MSGPHTGKWIIGLATATGFALLIATQNYFALSRAGRPTAWWMLAAGELPVWYTWLALTPAITGLTKRYSPLADPRWRNVGVHLCGALASTFVMIVVVTAARSAIGGLLPPGLGFWEAVRRGFANSFPIFLPIYSVIVAGILAWRYHRDTQEREIRETQLETELARAHLDSLRAQLQPHFLFNTLHAISALMSDDIVAARRMMRRLSELLRASLEAGDHEVTLDEELSFLGQYVEIQRIRFGDRLRVEIAADPEARSLYVPRLSLQPLVENAIKHGTAGLNGQGVVEVEARRSGDRLVIVVRDNGRGFPADRPPQPGVGLRNTRARIRHLFGDDASLELENARDGGARVRLEIPARTTPALED